MRHLSTSIASCLEAGQEYIPSRIEARSVWPDCTFLAILHKIAHISWVVKFSVDILSLDGDNDKINTPSCRRTGLDRSGWI